MSKIVVTNLPIKPRHTTKAGMFCTPIAMEMIAKLLNANTVLNYNILNSFEDKLEILKVFQNDLYHNGYNFDKEILDTSWRDKLLPHFEFMLKNGFIKEENQRLAHCDCLRVEILEDQIENLYDTKIIEKREDGLYCKHCNKKIEFKEESVLTFKLEESADDTLDIIPTRYANITKHFSKQFKGSKLLISKLRNTGYTFKTKNKEYNIDIDFILFQTPRTVDAERVVIVNSERQLYQLYLTNYVNNIMGFKKPLILAHPYIQDNEKLMDKILENDIVEIKKLAIMFNLTWTEAKSIWKNEIFVKLNNYAVEKVKDMFKHITDNTFVDINRPKSIEHALIKMSNISSVVNEYKKRQKAILG